jgi:diadenosine tetraphosphate (Ap4A) HIT family hydrolase
VTTSCLTCLSNSGEKRISPGKSIYEGTYWFVEHAYPVRQKGWVVIVLKRHAEALHDLTAEEFSELGVLQARLIKLLHETLNSEKEYVSCYAEKEGFRHVHLHVFAKPYDFPQELWGGGSFNLLKISEDEAPRGEIVELCELLNRSW